MTEREKAIQIAVDQFLAPIYAQVGRLVEEGGETPLADILSAYDVPITCADLHALYCATEQELAQ